MSTDVAVPLDTVPANGDAEISPMETDSGAEGTAAAVAPVKSRKRGAKAAAGTDNKIASPKKNKQTKVPSAGKVHVATTEIVHPKYNEMIAAAIVALKERHGSSRQAILKYILANYTVQIDERKVNNHLKMSLRAGVKNGKLQQSKGSGACGSYKLASPSKTKAATPKPAQGSSPSKALTKVKVPEVARTKITHEKKSKKSGKMSVSPKKATKSAKKAVAVSPAKQTKASPVKAKTPAQAPNKVIKETKTPVTNDKSKKAPKMEKNANAGKKTKVSPESTDVSAEPKAVDGESVEEALPTSQTKPVVAPAVETPATNNTTVTQPAIPEAAKTTKGRGRSKKTTH
ncbi:H1D-like protein [Mya arenaria]|uniref:H1D-like protein n=1 Tax=Mya arenaria TaxID=6604 RepID=A0ABY7DKF9_MYAAR|nr:histone H1.2-like [Mya arenaria]WAQ98174.1 H1D-like protein [Mya arenaria]